MIPLLLLIAIAGLMQAARSFTDAAGASATELAFGFLLLTAYFTARLVSRFGLPRLTGYLLAGVLAGPFVLELVTREMTESLRVVNGVATCILGLTAGAELNLVRVRPVRSTLRALIAIGVVGAIGVLAGVLFALRPMLPLFAAMPTMHAIAVCAVIAVALTPQSPAVVMALLSETRADGPLSQVMLASVVVADLVVVLCYAIAAAVAGAVIGNGVDVPALALSVGWELVGSVGFGVAIGIVIGAFVRSVSRGAALFALLICVVVAEIGSRVALDPLIVTLAAGIWLENFSRADASALLRGFESAQLPVFLVWFALSGTRLDPGLLVGQPGPGADPRRGARRLVLRRRSHRVRGHRRAAGRRPVQLGRPRAPGRPVARPDRGDPEQLSELRRRRRRDDPQPARRQPAGLAGDPAQRADPQRRGRQEAGLGLRGALSGSDRLGPATPMPPRAACREMRGLRVRCAGAIQCVRRPLARR